MSLLDTAFHWSLLVLAVGVAAVVAAGIGSLYGYIARGWNDERAARGTNLLVIGVALSGALPVWALVDAGMRVETPMVPEGVLGGLLASVAGALAAGVVGTATITGIVRVKPDLPGVSDPATVRRHYARYLTSLFAVILSILSVIEPVLETGTLAVGAVLAGLVLTLWVGAPFLATLTATTRRPTPAERDRIDDLLAASGLSVRGVRIIDADDRHVTVEVSGAPGGRFLLVSRAALETFTDDTLTSLLTARREQAAHYETAVGVVALVAPLVLLVGVIDGVLPITVGLVAIGIVGLAGLALTRRLRYYTDARAADRVGADTLADAFERACETAGFDLEDVGGRRLLSTTPSIATRIERLRNTAETG